MNEKKRGYEETIDLSKKDPTKHAYTPEFVPRNEKEKPLCYWCRMPRMDHKQEVVISDSQRVVREVK